MLRVCEDFVGVIYFDEVYARNFRMEHSEGEHVAIVSHPEDHRWHQFAVNTAERSVSQEGVD